MNNDLISREDLKEVLSSRGIKRWTSVYGEVIPFNWIISAIDNAPTVNTEDYDTGYQDGLEDGLNDIRPQGKWIYNQGSLKCSRCGYEDSRNHKANSNYCPYCGADMKNKGEEE